MPSWKSLLRRASPIAILTLFAIPLAQPLAHGWLTCTDDGLAHILRGIEIKRLIDLGHWLARWAPDLAHGYGYPLFNYYAPLSGYVLAGVHALGLNFSAALHATFAIALLGAGLAAYALGRDLWGEAAGVVAGVGYMSAPYFAFDMLFRGALAETFAWIWPPLILWALHRTLAASGNGSAKRPALNWNWGLVAATCTAGLLLTHNNLALLSSPLIAAFAGRLAWDRRNELRAGLMAGAMLALGLALAAFFWMPALAEQRLVRTDQLLAPPDFTYYTNYITPRELLAWPKADDPLLLNPSPAKALGAVPALLALTALPLLLRKRPDRSARLVGFFALALAGYALITLEITRPLWDHVPLLAFIQFPWRTLSLAALCASLLAGAGVQWLTGQFRLRDAWPAAVFSGALLLANLPWWYPRYCSPWQETNVASALRYEADSHTIGTSAKAEFLPRTVVTFPQDNRLAEALANGEEPDRVDAGGLPAGTQVATLSHDPLDTRFDIQTSQAFTLTYLTFYFPGWRASVDGQEVAVHPTPDHGLISFDVPAGSHRVRVYLGATPVRAAANAISITAALVWLGIAVHGLRQALRRRRHGLGTVTTGDAIATEVGSGLPPWLVLLPVGLLALKVAWIDRYPNPLRHTRFDGQVVANVQLPFQQDFEGGVRLYGADLSRQVVASGDSLDVVLYLGVRAPVQRTFWPTFAIEDDAGIGWSAAEHHVPRWHREPARTPLWPAVPDAYATWARQVTVLPGTPPGRYQLWLTVFDLETLQPNSILHALSGNPVAPRLLVGEVQVTRPAPDDVSSTDWLKQVESLSEQSLSDSLALVGYTLNPKAARPGDAITLTAIWRAEAKSDVDHTVLLKLVAANGTAVAEWNLPPVAGYSTSLWEAGDVWRGQHSIRLPAGLAAGRYRWLVRVSNGRPAALSEIDVAQVARIWQPPAVDVSNAVDLGGVARLVGHTLSGSPTPTVDLVWQALAETDTAYSVFVHVIDADGQVAAQSDAGPARNNRPTTSWLQGEYIVDEHLLGGLAPGEYQVFVGLYDPHTGERLMPVGAGAQADGRVFLGTWSFLT